MNFVPEIVWNGETCRNCGRDLHRECLKLDDCYFCSESCLGAYLVEKYEEEVEWVEFVYPEEVNAREREAWDDSMRDRDEFWRRHT